MPSAFAPTSVVITIDGNPVTAKLLSLESSLMASSPTVATVLLHLADPRDINVADYEEKTAVISLDGVPYLNGHVWGVRLTAGRGTLSVVLTIKDKRALIGKTWVGHRHMDDDGIKMIGADITFNKDNKPNKQVGVLAFVYDLPDTGEEANCDAIEGEYWTAKTAIQWLWQEYIDDITVPTIPDAAGFEVQIPETSLFGVQVDAALDLLFSKTKAGLYVDGVNTAHIFWRDTPRSTVVLTLDTSSVVIDSTAYTLDRPSYFDVNRSTENTLTNIDIIGGKQQKEILVLADEWYDAVSGVQVQPSPAPPVNAAFGPAFAIYWQNYRKQPVYKHGLRADVYEAHGCGKNIRRKDAGKPIMGELFTKRDREGNYLDPENECGIGGINVMEMVGQHFPLGAALDADRAEITETVKGLLLNPSGVSRGPPEKLAIVVESEVRAWVEGETPRGTLPSSYKRVAVIRNDFVHKTREQIEIAVPASLSWFADANTNYQEYHYVEAIDLTKLGVEGVDWQRNYTKDFYGTFADDGPTFKPTITLFAGVVQDGISPLQELADSLADEIGEPNVNVEGEFPSLRTLRVGDKITSSSADWGLTGDEIVVGISFDGRTQSFGFVATNHIGADAVTLSQRFIDTRKFRYPS